MEITDTTTAVRTWKGDKATVTVTFADGATNRYGGKRAANAAAVILFRCEGDTYTSVWGLRSSMATAQAEARRMATATVRRHRFGGVTHEIPVTPYPYAEAVAVTDA